MPSQPPMPGMGGPGMSPTAEGQMMTDQQGMANQAGQVPGMEIPPAAPGAPEEMAAPPPPGMDSVQSQVGSAQPGWGDLTRIAGQVVAWMSGLPDNERQHELVKMQLSNPHLYSLVLPMLQQSGGAEQNSAAMPNPNQKPPRRGTEAAVA